MVISKQGKITKLYDENSKTYGIESKHLKIVCEGSPDSLHADMGIQLYLLFMKESVEKMLSDALAHQPKHDSVYVQMDMILAGEFRVVIENVFNNTCLLELNSKQLKDYFSFDIIGVFHEQDVYNVALCGDGYIIKESTDGNIEFVRVSTTDSMPYIYNYLEEYNKNPQNEVVYEFNTRNFYSRDVNMIGVATRGVQPIVDSSDEDLKEKFYSLISRRDEHGLRMLFDDLSDELINDFTIVF